MYRSSHLCTIPIWTPCVLLPHFYIVHNILRAKLLNSLFYQKRTPLSLQSSCPVLALLKGLLVELLAFSCQISVPLSQVHLYLLLPSPLLRFTLSASTLSPTFKWPSSTNRRAPAPPFSTTLPPGSCTFYRLTSLISPLTCTIQLPPNCYRFLPPLGSQSGPPQPLTQRDTHWTLFVPASAPQLPSQTLSLTVPLFHKQVHPRRNL